MELETSTVHRNLDAKLRILGFELFDLLALLIFASTMNLIFGNTSLSFILVFVVPSILGAILYFGKKGKPDDFLPHFVRYFLMPGVFAAGQRPQNEDKKEVHIYDE